jgi:hypothetical protein
MKLSRDELEDAINIAIGFLADRASPTYAEKGLAGDFAEALVQIARACVVGLPCERHGGAVHGQEAEELRTGVEQILRNTASVREDEAAFVLPELRKSLIFLLDHVDARDSLAFREVTDPKDPKEDAAPCA